MKKKILCVLVLLLVIVSALYGLGLYLIRFDLQPAAPNDARRAIYIGEAQACIPESIKFVMNNVVRVSIGNGRQIVFSEWGDEEHVGENENSTGRAFAELIERNKRKFGFRGEIESVEIEDVSGVFAEYGAWRKALILKKAHSPGGRGFSLSMLPAGAELHENWRKAAQNINNETDAESAAPLNNIKPRFSYHLLLEAHNGAVQLYGGAYRSSDNKEDLIADAVNLLKIYQWVGPMGTRPASSDVFFTAYGRLDLSAGQVNHIQNKVKLQTDNKDYHVVFLSSFFKGAKNEFENEFKKAQGQMNSFRLLPPLFLALNGRAAKQYKMSGDSDKHFVFEEVSYERPIVKTSERPGKVALKRERWTKDDKGDRCFLLNADIRLPDDDKAGYAYGLLREMADSIELFN